LDINNVFNTLFFKFILFNFLISYLYPVIGITLLFKES